MTRFLFFVFLCFSIRAEAKEFTCNQYWSVQAIRYTDSRDNCLEEVHRWAKNDVQFQCRTFFAKLPATAAQCEIVNVEFRDSDYTDRLGSQCQTTAILNVDE